MADTDIKPHGTPAPKGTSWLKEVRLDAARNTVESLRRQNERKEFEEAKARGITVEDLISKGREDLHLPDASLEGDEEGFLEDDATTEDLQAKEDEIAELKKQLQAARAAETRATNKLKASEVKDTTSQPDDKKEEVK